MVLVIGNAHEREIREHGARAYPNECCGAILGVVSESDEKIVRALLPLSNRREGEAARTRFLVTAEDYRWAEQQARAQGLEILGFYHSHPDHPARPSEFDREWAWPWLSYVITSVFAGRAVESRAWRLKEDRGAFEEEIIEVIDDQ